MILFRETIRHGLEPRKIHGIRRSLIVNYVTQEWRARDEIS